MPHFRAMHTKALPHNDNDDVDEKEFCKFIKAVEYGNPKYIDQIRLGTPGGLKPVSPRDLFNSDLFGKYLAGYRLPLSWTLGSKRAAADSLKSMPWLLLVTFLLESIRHILLLKNSVPT